MRALLRLAAVRDADDLAAIERAFVHESHAKERGGASNERMEFLGDSVLGFIAASWLFEKYPAEPEGTLHQRKAAIVNDAALARTARRLDFAGMIQLGVGTRGSGGADNTSILADAFEAFVAALYLTFGLEKARVFVVGEHIETLDHSVEELLDAKTRLQHYAQQHLASTPVYRETTGGTPQQPSFASQVVVKGQTLGTGSGPSKRAAQQAAAEAALVKLRTQHT
ncbi:MAG TPA: ribonuclease III [Candidatus Acidoferrales bacterium]|nr:ribonuclease III [Candidatus Acidoferrales bacterium]